MRKTVDFRPAMVYFIRRESRIDMMTPFGIAIRKLRLDKGLRLLDLAEKMNLSSSFISAVETGKKPIPPNYVGYVIDALGLAEAEAVELQRAADQSKTVVDLNGLQGGQRELVAAFARKLDDLPADLLEKIKKHIYESLSGEIPFKRKRKGHLVDAASTQALWGFAEKIRSVFVSEQEIRFPIMEVLEFRLPLLEEDFHLSVCDKDEMGSEEGLVIAGSNCIKLREDVYEGAWSGVGRDRFTACHELGHYLLHRQVSFARVRDDHHPVYKDAEWQADTFAGALLLSSKHLTQLKSPENAAIQCGITPMAAAVMWSKYEKENLF